MAKEVNNDFPKVLEKFDQAYNAGSKTWFDYLDEQVVVFSQNSAEPFQGKKDYRAFFEKNLVGSKRNVKIVSRKIRTLGETSIVTQSIQINQADVIVNVKQSQVWGLKKEGWKLNHLHSTFASAPYASDALAKKTKSINLINEKIATIAAVVGVAQ